jgi:hypothetical protein
MTSTALPPKPEREDTWASGNAIDDVATDLRRMIDEVLAPSNSLTFGRRLWELDAACLEASRAGWDGYDAAAVDWQTYLWTRRFLQALPVTWRDPDIAVDPDGELSLTWQRSPGHVFSVSVANTGRLSYAGLFGKNTAHGTEYFDETVPHRIAGEIARLFPQG